MSAAVREQFDAVIATFLAPQALYKQVKTAALEN